MGVCRIGPLFYGSVKEQAPSTAEGNPLANIPVFSNE
jgi:hypothetical protein